MKTGKVSAGLILAGVVTFLLLVLMYTLVKTDEVPFDDEAKAKILDPVMPEVEVTENPTERDDRPTKTDEPEPPITEPEPPVDPVFEPTDPGVGGFEPGVPPVDRPGMNLPDSDMPMPLVKVAPVYPQNALEKGIEGHCTVEYSVTKTGATRDIEPVDCQPKGVFERASVSAATKFKYSPKVVNGEPVDVAGMQNRFVFELEK